MKCFFPILFPKFQHTPTNIQQHKIMVFRSAKQEAQTITYKVTENISVNKRQI